MKKKITFYVATKLKRNPSQLPSSKGIDPLPWDKGLFYFWVCLNRIFKSHSIWQLLKFMTGSFLHIFYITTLSHTAFFCLPARAAGYQLSVFLEYIVASVMYLHKVMNPYCIAIYCSGSLSAQRSFQEPSQLGLRWAEVDLYNFLKHALCVLFFSFQIMNASWCGLSQTMSLWLCACVNDFCFLVYARK